MPNKAYAPDFKLRCVALASVRSIPIASKELGVPEDTLTRWVAKQPHTPALEQAVNLALSELTARMASGALSPRDLTVAYGVLRDKQARYGKEDTAPPITEAEKWGDDLEKALHKRYGKDACLALVLALPWFEAMPEDAEGPSVADTLKHIASLGDIHETRKRRQAEDQEAHAVDMQRVRNAAQWAARGYPPAECWVRGADGPPGPDPEVLELLEEAERWLAAHLEPAP